MRKFLFILPLLIFLFTFGVFSNPVLAAPPPDFQTNLVSENFNSPTGFEIAPDGRIFVLEKGGTVKIVKNGSLLAEPFTTINVNSDTERGLLGIAFDPDFNTNKFVYFYYTGSDLLNRIARYDASGDKATVQPVTIYTNNVPAGTIHQAGTIQFGPDGKLYLSIGNSGNPGNSSDLTTVYGKILRLNKDGSIPSDNPFVNDSGKKGEIWAYGLRNPFRFQFDKETGRLYTGDVGDSKWEEINLITKGGNYGYPNSEGSCFGCSTINPIYQYFHDGNQSFSVSGGPVYRGAMFPEEYKGSYFFGDYPKGFIKRLTLDSNGNQTGVFDFDLNAGTVVDMKVATDGSLYYLTIYPGKLFKVTYKNANQSPIVKAVADVESGAAPLTVKFSSEGSSDPENQSLTYSWNFGDGTTSSEANPTKVFNNNGNFEVVLSVSDGVNTAISEKIIIQVGKAPVITIKSPADNSKYNAGDVINYEASAVDGNGNPVVDGSFTTTVLFHHDTHVHPFLQRTSNRFGSFIIPAKNDHPDANTWYEIQFKVKDSENLESSKSVSIYPNSVNLNFTSDPSGLLVLVDSIPYRAPISLKGVAGFVRELKPVLIQELNNNLYQFQSWSNSGPMVQSITTPREDSSYNANFSLMPEFNAEYFNNRDLSGTPVLKRQDKKIDFVWNESSPDAAINADGFSVRWIKKQSFAAGKYNFTVVSDDGIRVWIDGKLIIDEWHDQAATEVNGTQVLTKGDHEIKVEYYENYGGAIAKLNWDYTQDQPEILPGYKAEYFDNKSLSGTPKKTVDEQKIDFAWDQKSPDAQIPADQFSARFTKEDNFDAGEYRFNFAGDDGIRMFIDGQKVFDKWFDQPVNVYSYIHKFSTGKHKIVLEYYENYGGAFLKMNYQKVDLNKGYESYYFDNKDLWGIPKLVKEDSEINNIWNYAGPASLSTDRFSARWIKDVNFSTSGNYKFLLQADDGIRFYVDDKLIVNDWADHSMKTYQPIVNLNAGVHTVKVEFYENMGSAVAIFKQSN